MADSNISPIGVHTIKNACISSEHDVALPALLRLLQSNQYEPVRGCSRLLKVKPGADL